MEDNKCGCNRPLSCGYCRSETENEEYWNEKMEDLQYEAEQEEQDNKQFNIE